MSSRADKFTFERIITAEITATATPTSIGDLIADRLAEGGFEADNVQQVIIMEKIADGTNRGAINIGEDADHMNLYYGAGVAGDPPSGHSSWFLARVGGTDVDCIAMIGLGV